MKHVPLPHTPSLYDDVVGAAYVPQDHLLRRVRAAVDFGFVHDLVADLYHDSNGRPAYDPEVLLRLIFLQLQYKLSDRGVIERAQTDHAFRFFLGLDWNDELPHPTSLTNFRERLGEERFKAVFHGFLQQALQRKLVSNKRLMIDSYSVQADIAVPGFRTLLDRVIAKGLASLEGTAVDLQYLRSEHESLRLDKSYRLGPEFRTQLLAEWLSLAELVAEALEELGSPTVAQQESLELLNGGLQRAANHRKRNVKKDDLLSDVDPDARWSRKKRGKQVQAGYSEQLAVDAEHGIVTHVEVMPGNSDDTEALQEMVAGHGTGVGAAPESVVTDSKYQSGENRQYLAEAEIGDDIAAQAAKGSKQGKFTMADFALEFDATGKPTVALCPAGELAEAPNWKKDSHSWVFQFKKAQCAGCPLRARCSKQTRGRQLSVDQHYPLTEQARARQATEAGEEAQIARLGIERQFSYQQRQGGRRTRYRGLDKNRLLGWAWGMYLNVTRLTRLAWDGQARPTEAHPTEAPFKSRAKAQLPGVDCA